MGMAKSNYERDFYAWTIEQVNLLKLKKYEQVDFKNIIEEIEALGRSERRELMNRMTVLVMHLLKWYYQPEKNGASWGKTIKEQRKQISRSLANTPSLKTILRDEEWLQNVWDYAIEDAVDETNLEKSIFSPLPIWSIEQILDDNFYPESDIGI